MSDNLYNKILDIREDITSPNHYELLGLALFESNPRKVHRAGLRCLRKLKDWQLHPDPKTARAVQEIMNQVGVACTILELPEKKDEYDRQLADKLGIVPPTERPTQSMPKVAQPEIVGDIRIIGLEDKKSDVSKKTLPKAKNSLFEIQKHLKECPNCKAQLSELAQICVDCGYSFTLDKVLKTSFGSKLYDRIVDNVRISRKAMFRIILVLFLAVMVYYGHHAYNEYGLGYWNYKINISDDSLATIVRHEVRDSNLWKICTDLAQAADKSRPYFTFALSEVDGAKSFSLRYDGEEKPVFEVNPTGVITPEYLKNKTAEAALEVLSHMIKQNPGNMVVLAKNFKLLPDNYKKDIFNFLKREPEGMPLTDILSGINIMIKDEKSEPMLTDLTNFSKLLENKIEIQRKAKELKSSGKLRSDLLSCFNYFSKGETVEKAAALSSLMRYPLKSANKERLNLLEIVVKSTKRSLDARCLAAWMLSGYVGSEYHKDAMAILEKAKTDAPEKLITYIDFARQMFDYDLSRDGFAFPGTSVAFVPVLVNTPQQPVLLDKPYMISRFEITEEQYQAVTGMSGDKLPGKKPVVKVSWYDAVVFCRKLTEYAKDKRILKSGWEVRLPTGREFMAARNAIQAGTLLDREALPGDLMREWCLDYVKVNKLGVAEFNDSATVNLKGNANLALGYSKNSKNMKVAVFPWLSSTEMGFRVVMAPVIKLKSEYLEKRMGLVKPVAEKDKISLFVLDKNIRAVDDVPLDILMERGFAWHAPDGASEVVEKKDGRTYKASGVQIFRFENLGQTKIIWTGGRRFQWKAVFKFNNGQETLRSGTGNKTCTFDIVLPKTEKYIVMQIASPINSVYTDYVSEEKFEGKAASLSSGRDKIDLDYDYVLDLVDVAEKTVAKDHSGGAWCMLKNAMTLGEDVPRLKRLLAGCSPPNLDNSMPKLSPLINSVKPRLAVLRSKTDLKHSGIEAAMLLDCEIVGNGLFVTVGGKNAPDELFVFANQNKLPLTDIKRIYGKPTAEYVADDNSRYLFYGRIFFCLVQGTEVPYVARFNISNKDDGTYLREPK